MPTIYQIAIVALVVAFIVLFINKTNIRYTMRDVCDTKKLSIIAKMLDCDFCLCFWTSFIIAVVLAIYMHDVSYIIVPLFSTPIARILL